MFLLLKNDLKYKSNIKLYFDLLIMSIILSILLTFGIIELYSFNYEYLNKDDLIISLLNINTLIIFFLIPYIYKKAKKIKQTRIKTNISIDDI
jgi:amino acid permease